MIYTSEYPSPVGRLLLASENDALTGLWIEGQKYYPLNIKDSSVPDEDSPVLLQSKRWLDRYFAGEKPALSALPLSPQGSLFRREVWNILCTIPYGETMTYSEIARQIAVLRGIPSMSAQAVGGAVGHNPVSIIIPCHRVIGSKGSLTGYAGGIDKKMWLLSHEGAAVNALTYP